MPTYPTNPPGNTLAAIQQKVRRLTRSPSEAQLTTDDLNNYINTFVMYDFPEHLRTFNLRKPFRFWCNPYQDVYPLNINGFGNASQAYLNPLYNFQNLNLTVHPPLYIAGYHSMYTQSREHFYNVYPDITSRVQLPFFGDGVTTTFSGVIPSLQYAILPPNFQQQTCFVKGKVLFESVDLNGNGLALVDVPVLDSTTGNPTIYGNLYTPGTQPVAPNLPLMTPPYVVGGPCNINSTNCIDPFNYINYTTGQYTITFPFAPRAYQKINSQTVPKAVARPHAMLFFDNHFILRTVPDQPYEINFEVYVRPAQLMQTDSVPELEEYWQYLSYGTAKKVFEDRMDIDSVQLIMPEFKKQEALVQRRTIVQYTNERVATIYTEQTGINNNNENGWGSGGSSF